ncbi:MAG: M15 family metallopeptidase [Myxococcales bacterium]|nr:M15 family metallopeptidase [Myxococcales bacterium]MDD9968937.1 M15 family metallopeptidase [Myxococcales bacterium]
MPADVVQAFERHGFIWGGRWYHYDTMHFEYRPELLARADVVERPVPVRR